MTRSAAKLLYASKLEKEEISLPAILFDLDNTLIDRDRAVELFCDHWLADAGVEEHERAEMLPDIMAWDNHGYSDRRSWAQQVAALTGHMASDFWQSFYNRLPSFFTIDSEICEVCQRVSQQRRIAILSNGTSAMQRAKLRASGLDVVFTNVFVSEEVGSWKPDLQIFQHAMSQLQTNATETIMVGDDPQRDIAPASQLGMETHWITRGRSLAANAKQPTHCHRTIQDFLNTL